MSLHTYLCRWPSGKQIGPIDAKALRQLAAEGILTREALIQQFGGSGRWKPAGEIQGLIFSVDTKKMHSPKSDSNQVSQRQDQIPNTFSASPPFSISAQVSDEAKSIAKSTVLKIVGGIVVAGFLITILVSIFFYYDYSKRYAFISKNVVKIEVLMQEHNQNADNILQQISNGSARTVDFLALIAVAKGVKNKKIEDLLATYSNHDRAADTVYQQIANANYTGVELLALIAVLDGVQTSDVQQVLEALEANNSKAENVQHQILNSTNRTFELFKLIAIRSRVSIKSIEEITSSWERNNSSAKTIFQQIANGSLRSVELLNMIVLKSNPNREALEVIMRRYRENNASATNVNHQQCNGQYRIAELCSIWAISSVPWVQ
jgi:GYF domain 2